MGFRRSRTDDRQREREPRINHRIRVPEVRLVGVDGDQLGIVQTSDAMRMAQEAGVDLVEVAATARPPVCRLMDYGKFKYLAKKQKQEAKRKSTQIEVKEVKFRPKTEKHDFDTKMNRARKFLGDGNRVKITIMFRGRELAYTDAQRKRCLKIAELLVDVAQVDVPPRMEGRTMSMMLNPTRKGGGKAKEAAPSGSKSDSAKSAGTKSNGAKNDGAKNDGAKNDGAKNDGAKNDGAKNDGAKNDGAKNDGAKSDGAESDGAKNVAVTTVGAKSDEGGNAASGE